MRSRSVRNSARLAAVEFLSLESRRLMHVDPNDPNHVDELPNDLGTFPIITADPTTGSGGTTGSGVAASSPLSAVPALSSRPSAYAKIYLDFTGDTTSTWGSYHPGTTPAYDTDGDATTFSDAELASIREIFNRVAEKYSPFNVDVTTTNPGNLNDRQTLKVVIGGDGAWLGAQAGGVSYVGAFANSAPNVSFVFPKMLANGYAKYVAEASAHESGHAFGLQHQGTYDAYGNLTAEYAPANAAGDAPIMGSSYTARRGLWWYGTASDYYGHMQDDLAVISSSTNGFGYRADDYGNTVAASTALSESATSVSGAGVIEKTTDADVFSFTTGAGAVTLEADPAAQGGMLDVKLDLRDASGNLVAASDNGLSESISTNLAAGKYYLTVSSHGSYGDIGQYTIQGTVAAQVVTPQPTVPAAPSNLTATRLSTSSIRLSWIDNSSDETGFKVYSSRDGVSWNFLGTVGANVTSVDNTGLKRNVTYYYKVRAYNAVGDSIDSNVASSRTSLNAATAPIGDANLDGAVDFNDLTIVAQNYNAAVGPSGWTSGDFNGDGVVNFDDLNLLAQNYGTPASADTTGSDTGTLTPVTDQVVIGVTTSGATATTTTTKTTASKDKVAATLKSRPFSVVQIHSHSRPAVRERSK